MKKLYVALVFLSLVGCLRAQSPGGVGTTNLSLWLKPDGLAAGSLGTWAYSNNGNQFTSPSGSQPTVSTNVFNFLPAVNFNASQYMTGPTGTPGAPLALNQLSYAIFAVWTSNVAVGGGNMRVWNQREAGGGSAFDGAALWVYPGGANPPTSAYSTSASAYGDQPEIYPFTTGVAYPTSTASIPYSWTYTSPSPGATAQTILTYAPGTAYISSMNLLNQNTNDLELMDQSNYGTTPAVTSTDPNASATTNRLLSDQANLLGMRTTSGDEAFNGNLAELIIFNTSVTAMQRQQVFSYLSLKYGIPLSGPYYSGAGATIWDATQGGGAYNHFVFGLAQDNASGLNVTQSNSAVTGSGSGAGQSNMGNIVLSGASALADQGFLIIGSNNTGFTETMSNVPTVASGSSRVTNTWLAQTSGSVGTVDLSFDLTGITTTGTKGTSSDFRLVTDNNGDASFGSASQSYYTPTSWSNGNTVANFTGVTLTNNAVFTIITNATGATPLPVNWVNFTAIPNSGNVNLNWTVGANQQAKVYDVQRSVDGTNFTQIGEVTNDPNVQSYSYVDAGVGSGTYYYRVLEVDRSGESIYSKIVSVNMNSAAFAIKLLNNPTISGNTEPELQLTTNVSGNALMEIWTLSGSRVGSFQQAIGAGTTTMRVPVSSLSAGTYALKVTVNNTTQTVQVVKL